MPNLPEALGPGPQAPAGGAIDSWIGARDARRSSLRGDGVANLLAGREMNLRERAQRQSEYEFGQDQQARQADMQQRKAQFEQGLRHETQMRQMDEDAARRRDERMEQWRKDELRRQGELQIAEAEAFAAQGPARARLFEQATAKRRELEDEQAKQTAYTALLGASRDQAQRILAAVQERHKQLNDSAQHLDVQGAEASKLALDGVQRVALRADISNTQGRSSSFLSPTTPGAGFVVFDPDETGMERPTAMLYGKSGTAPQRGRIDDQAVQVRSKGAVAEGLSESLAKVAGSKVPAAGIRDALERALSDDKVTQAEMAQLIAQSGVSPGLVRRSAGKLADALHEARMQAEDDLLRWEAEGNGPGMLNTLKDAASAVPFGGGVEMLLGGVSSAATKENERLAKQALVNYYRNSEQLAARVAQKIPDETEARGALEKAMLHMQNVVAGREGYRREMVLPAGAQASGEMGPAEPGSYTMVDPEMDGLLRRRVRDAESGRGGLLERDSQGRTGSDILLGAPSEISSWDARNTALRRQREDLENLIAVSDQDAAADAVRRKKDILSR